MRIIHTIILKPLQRQLFIFYVHARCLDCTFNDVHSGPDDFDTAVQFYFLERYRHLLLENRKVHNCLRVSNRQKL